MKHQLFKKGTYVQIDTGKDHLTVISKVKDSTIKRLSLGENDGTFNLPKLSIELETRLMILHEDPDILPMVYDNFIFLYNLIKQFNHISFYNLKLYVDITQLEIPSKKLKEMFYTYVRKEPINHK